MALVAVVGLTACGDGGEGRSASGCSAVVREPFDPDSIRHVLPGSADPRYRTDPPTSGAHTPGAPLAGAVDAPIAKPVQVGLLEAGLILVQHHGLSPQDEAALRAIGSDQIVVAPADSLPAPVVATAWLHKVTCSGVTDEALDELQGFARDRFGQGPGIDH